MFTRTALIEYVEDKLSKALSELEDLTHRKASKIVIDSENFRLLYKAIRSLNKIEVK